MPFKVDESYTFTMNYFEPDGGANTHIFTAKVEEVQFPLIKVSNGFGTEIVNAASSVFVKAKIYKP